LQTENCTLKVRLSEPLRAARLVDERARAAQELEAQLRGRYEQGLRDGEKGLREQLLQQRS
jgi:hypothetical protein